MGSSRRILTEAFQRGKSGNVESEHSVILTFPVTAVDSAQTPDRECRYTWHIVALTWAGCWPHTTKHRSACAVHDKGICSTIRSPPSPADSPLDAACGRPCGPGAHRDSPSNWQSLLRLRLTAPASVSSPPSPEPLCPGRAGAWS